MKQLLHEYFITGDLTSALILSSLEGVFFSASPAGVEAVEATGGAEAAGRRMCGDDTSNHLSYLSLG